MMCRPQSPPYAPRRCAQPNPSRGDVTLTDVARKISLLLADVDGTLVTHEKILTERARNAVHRLHRAGIRFALTSGRPPRGMAMFVEPLALDTPTAGFNGGGVVHPH